MNASPMAAVRKAIATILEADPELSVVNVFSDELFMGNKTVCYPYVSAITYDTTDEARRGSGYGTADVDILCNATCERDPGRKGIKSDTAADIVSRIKYRLETFDLNTLGTYSDGRYSTVIVAIAVDGNVGDFDDGSGKIRTAVSTTVIFGQYYTS